MAASGIAGLTLLNCFSSSSARCRTRSLTMAVSTDQKPSTEKLTLRKSEEAFAAAKVILLLLLLLLRFYYSSTSKSNNNVIIDLIRN